jgi:hypothetical protein
MNKPHHRSMEVIYKDVDLRRINPRKVNPRKNGTVHKNKGKICGANHTSINPISNERHTQSLRLVKYRSCPFYMVEGIEVITKEVESINTNCGVLCMDDLEKL